MSDCYAAYTSDEGRRQYCWAHLPRDVDELVSQQRRDASVVGWADAVHALYQRATASAVTASAVTASAVTASAVTASAVTADTAARRQH